MNVVTNISGFMCLWVWIKFPYYIKPLRKNLCTSNLMLEPCAHTLNDEMQKTKYYCHYYQHSTHEPRANAITKLKLTSHKIPHTFLGYKQTFGSRPPISRWWNFHVRTLINKIILRNTNSRKSIRIHFLHWHTHPHEMNNVTVAPVMCKSTALWLCYCCT
jgi:hypothetical protein